MYNVKLLNALDWTLIKEQLASFCVADATKDCILTKPMWLDSEDVAAEWERVDQLLKMSQAGFAVPLGDFVSVSEKLEFVSRGGVLDGSQLLEIKSILELSQSVSSFAQDFSTRFPYLKEVRTSLYVLPHLRDKIKAAIDPDGAISDDATPELHKIRKELRGYTSKIEQALHKWMQNPSNAKYLQDQFFTIRSDRYVVPLKLDGNGRVDVRVIDTSGSGNSVFVEPFAIKELNDYFLQLRLKQRIEELKILRDLSDLVRDESDFLKYNYDTLLALDIRLSKATLAKKMSGIVPQVTEEIGLSLIDALHPLLKLQDPETSVGQDIILGEQQKCLVVSGPNAGGKTISLKIIGLMQLMAKAGLLLPVDSKSNFFFFKNLHVELGDAQDLGQNLSSFSGHLRNIQKINGDAEQGSLILLDEIASGTDAATGAALAQALLDSWIEVGATVVVTTHLDALKNLALEDKKYRNASVAFDFEKNKPLFKLHLDVPGASLGIELAERLQFDPAIIARAKGLRKLAPSGGAQELQDQLRNKIQQFENQKEELKSSQNKLIEEQARWEHEKNILLESKKTIRSKVRGEYSLKFESMERDFFSLTKEVKALLKKAKQNPSQNIRDDLSNLTSKFQGTYNAAKDSAKNEPTIDLKDGPLLPSDLKKGVKVFVESLQKTGQLSEGVDEEKMQHYSALLKKAKAEAPQRELALFLKRQKVGVSVGGLKIIVPLADLKSLA